MTLIAIEGTIGAGKTTFLNELSKELTRKGFQHGLLCEPVHEWQAFGPTKQNLLQEMYHNPRSYSFSFQLVALLTKCEQVSNSGKELLLVERTILAQLNIFLPLLKENGSITDLEYEICFRLMRHLSTVKANQPSLIVYLRIDPKLAKERIVLRGRTEETKIGIEYLLRIHDKYEKWLISANNVLVLDSNKTFQFADIAQEIIHRLKLNACK
jgi:deoxyadenosine/deoxycytidine kinase